MSEKFIKKIKDRIEYHADETKYRYEIGKDVMDCLAKDIIADFEALGAVFPPCNVRDTVYVIHDAEVEYGGKAVIEHCTVSEVSTHRVWIENNSKAFKRSDIGKTLFIDKAEAQDALERMEEQE